MVKLLRKLFIPHECNNHHPHAIRHYSFLAYALIFLLANYVAFPILGINKSRALASTINTDELISLTNQERQAKGLNLLKKNDRLTAAAIAKGNDMLKKQYWDHFGKNGETPWQFIKGSGYNYIFAGENLAKDFQTSLEAHLAWMHSPTHKENILNSNFKDIGIAIVKGDFFGKDSTIIIQMFGNDTLSSNQPSQASISPDNLSTKFLPPAIEFPQGNSVLNATKVKGEGVAKSDDTIDFYSNNKLQRELSRGKAAFLLSSAQKVNLSFMLILTSIVLLDAAFVIKRRIRRDAGKHYHLTIAIILVIVVGMVIV